MVQFVNSSSTSFLCINSLLHTNVHLIADLLVRGEKTTPKEIWTGEKIVENQPLRTFWEINHSDNSEKKTIFSTKKSYMHRSFQEFIFMRLKNLTSKSWKLFTSSILCLLIHFQTVAMCWTHLLPLEKIFVSFL